MPRSGNIHKSMTVERALAEAHKAGCAFRLAGVGVDVRGIDAVPADVVSFLRGNRELVFDHLGGNQRDRPSLAEGSAGRRCLRRRRRKIQTWR